MTVALLFFLSVSAHAAVYPCASSAPDSFWQSLQKQISGSVVLPSSKNWGNASMQWNLIYPRDPIGVVYAADVRDVVTTILLAKLDNVCIVPRSSGHSYSGQAVLSGRLVLDVSYLNATSYDASSKQLTAGPGTNLWMLVDACEKENLMLTWGGCGDVRLGGYLQGGGEGNGERITGVGIDRVASYDIVLANGTFLPGVSAQYHADLFWALRGGGGPGGNFGVVTSMQLLPRSIFPDIASVLYYSIIVSPKSALEMCGRFFKPAPDAFGAGLLFLQTGAVFVNGWWLGNVTEGRAFLDALVEGLELESSDITNTTLYNASRTDFHAPTTGHGVYFSGAHSVQATKIPSQDEWQQIINFVTTAPPLNRSDGLFIVAAYLTGGAANTVARNATAFPHRNSFFDFEWATSLHVNTSEANFTKWGDAFYEIVKPIFTVDDQFGVYSNLADFTLADAQEHYYLENYPRLRQLKALYDPENYLSFPQSIDLP